MSKDESTNVIEGATTPNGRASREVRTDFQLLYETAPAAFLVLAPDPPRFTIVAASDAYLRSTKTSRDIIGRGIFEVFPDNPHDPASTGNPARASFERVLATATPDTMAVQKHSIPRPEAEGGGFEERYRSPLNTPVLGDDGEVLYIHHRVEDVTEFVRAKQKRAEHEAAAEPLRTRTGEMEADVLRRAWALQDVNQQLRAANERLAQLDAERQRRADERVREGIALLQAISDSSPDVMFAKDRDGRMTFANPAALALIGKPLGEVLGRTDAEFLDDKDAARHVMENDRRIMDHGVAEEVEERVPLPDGSERFWLSRKTPYRDRSGNVVGLLGVSRDITERKRAADALRESEERLRAAHERLRVQVESTPLALVEWDSEYRVVGYSGRAQETFGWSPDEVIGKRIDEIPWVPEEDWPLVRAVMRDMSSGARPTNVSANRNLRKDGRAISCEWYNSTLHDERGRLVSVLSLVLDVTKRERAVEALRESEQRLRATFEDAAVGIMEVDACDRFVDVNARFCAMLGYSRDELVGRTIHEITAPEDERVTRDLNSRANAGELRVFDYEKRYVRRDGSLLWAHVTVSVVRDEAGRFVRAIGTAEDITERKRVQEALRESEARFRSVVENQSEGLMIFDASGNTVFQNRASLRIHGVDAETDGLFARADLPVSWRGWDEDGRPLPFEEWPVSRVLRKERVREQILRAERVETGHQFWASYNGAPVFDADGKLAYGFITIREITARIRAQAEERRAQAALRAASEKLLEADRRKDEFLGMLSHELRNPLAPIQNSIFVLERATAGEQAQRARAVIKRQTEHLTRLVDDLLDVTRVARGKIELRRSRVDLREVVLRAVDDFRLVMEDRGVALHTVFPDGPAWADADPTRITQVIGNLLHNAAKFTRKGDEVHVALEVRGCEAQVRVRDTGTGIAPPLLPTIFEPFVQGERTLARTEGGLGLGLALVKGITELHGGSARAESEGRGKGTTFEIRLPLVPAQPASARVRDAARERGASRRILVVDDNVDAAESLADLLRMLGHEVEVVFDGPAAVEAARARRPAFVLCDIGLPGMDGYEVAKAIRADASGAGPVLVAVSGYAQPEDVQRAVDAGFDAHIAKPPAPEKIERLLAT